MDESSDFFLKSSAVFNSIWSWIRNNFNYEDCGTPPTPTNDQANAGGSTPASEVRPQASSPTQSNDPPTEVQLSNEVHELGSQPGDALNSQTNKYVLVNYV